MGGGGGIGNVGVVAKSDQVRSGSVGQIVEVEFDLLATLCVCGAR